MTRTLVLALTLLLTACQTTGTVPAAQPAEANAATPQETGTISPTPPEEAKPTPAPQPPPNPSGWVLRTPEEIQAQGNHLKDSGSVYLLQHAKNPLEWYPWGEVALERARLEDKPIFLSIGYASCHWCHVMEHKVFEQPDVAAFMNEHFVCIKVDREERPDLDTIYMDAVQSLTGRGGWPMTVLLTPSLKPFFGGTYFPKPRFMGIVRDALERFHSTRQEVEAEGDQIYAKIARTALPNARTKIQDSALQTVVGRAVGTFDLEWGGRQQRMKFPTPIRWRFLLHAWRRWGGDDIAKGVRLTLDQMAAGGIHDQLGGGFHRYTTERTWLVPHFEKMLYDNTQLASLYIEAAAAFGEDRYLDVAKKTLDYMLKEMYAAEGGFYASYDADSGGEEGTFYVWTPAELNKIAGPEDGEALALLLGVTDRGNFEHRTSILTWRSSFKEVAKQTRRRAKDIAAVWERWQPVLYDVRSKRIWPGLDKKLVTSWNGLAIGAMAMGFTATGDSRYIDAARRTADLIWRLHRTPAGGLYRVSNGGKPSETGVLDDYGFLAGGLLRLYEASGDLKYLQYTKTLITEAEARFARPGGGYFMAEDTDKSLILRPFEPFDSVRPSGNSALIDAQLRLAALTGDEALFDKVDRVLNAYAGLLSRAGLGMAGWLAAALQNQGPFYEVIIAGDPEAKSTKKLDAAYKTLAPPWAVRVDVPEAGASEALTRAVPPTAGKRGGKNKALAYVCVRGSCKKPTSDPKTFRKQLLDGWTQ